MDGSRVPGASAYLLAGAGARESWMDRFTKLETEGGFRAIVKRTWNGATLTSGNRQAPLAAFAEAA
jgi:hypothetical protein